MTPPLSAPFIAECELISIEERTLLELDDFARLDPRQLAEALAIDVISIDRYREQHPSEVRWLTRLDYMSFSAATAFCGRRCAIVVNTAPLRAEEIDPVAHELGHILVEHPPHWPPFDEAGQRLSGEREEAEADYMAEALLVPHGAVGPVMEAHDEDLAAAAAHFNVSEALMARRVARFHNSKSEEWSGVAPIVDLPELGDEALPHLLQELPRRGQGQGAVPKPPFS